jgi:phosphoglycolate phosphatase
MSRSFDSVIFDLDGTLIDSAPGILQGFAEAFAYCGVTPQAPWSKSLIGPPLTQTIAQQCGSQDPVLLERIKSTFVDRYDNEGFKLSAPYSGIQAMLQTLCETKIKLFIATNKRIHPTQRIMQHLDWASMFEGVYGIDSLVSPPLPQKRDVIQHITAHFNLSQARTLYVGDRYEDYQAATSAGLDFALATWGFEDAEDLVPPNELRLECADALCALVLNELGCQRVR